MLCVGSIFGRVGAYSINIILYYIQIQTDFYSLSISLFIIKIIEENKKKISKFKHLKRV